MRNYIASHVKVTIMLLLSLCMLCGCSSEKEMGAENKPSEGQQETEKISTDEIVSDESEADTMEATVIEVDWEKYFGGINGSAVIYDPSENSYQIYNQKMALTQRSPCSTFKIISSLIALENKVIIPDNSTREWSGEVFWNENWNRNINFEDAFRTSCVWYYREIIDEIGKNVMQEELNKLHYGNCDISDWEGYLNTNSNNRSLTGFWIESSLKISPKEQIEVLDRIFGEHSVYSQETQNSLKQVMLLSEYQDTDMLVYGKTGLGKSYGVVVDAWFTGFVDTANSRKYFCVYLGETDGKNVSSTIAKEIAIEIVSDLEKVQ